MKISEIKKIMEENKTERVCINSKDAKISENDFCYAYPGIKNGSYYINHYFPCCDVNKDLLYSKTLTNCPVCKKTKQIIYFDQLDSPVEEVVESRLRVIYFDKEAVIFEKVDFNCTFSDNAIKKCEICSGNYIVFYTKSTGLRMMYSHDDRSEEISNLPYSFWEDDKTKAFLSLKEFCSEKVANPTRKAWSEAFNKLSVSAKNKKTTAQAKRQSQKTSYEKDTIKTAYNALKKVEPELEKIRVSFENSIPPEGHYWGSAYCKNTPPLLIHCQCGYSGFTKTPRCPDCRESVVKNYSDPGDSTYSYLTYGEDGSLILIHLFSSRIIDPARKVDLKILRVYHLSKTKTSYFYYDSINNKLEPDKKRKFYESYPLLNIDEVNKVIDNSVFKTSGYKEYLEIFHNLEVSDISSSFGYINAFKVVPAIEQFMKLGMKQLVKDFILDKKLAINKKATNPRQALGISNFLFKLARENDLSYHRIYDVKRIMEADKSCMDKDDLLWATSDVNSSNVLAVLENTSLTVKKIREYILSCYEEQCIEPNEALATWKDYILMAKKLNTKYRIFPSSLRKEHDVLVFATAACIDKEKCEIFDNVTHECKKYEYSFEDYVIKAPTSAADLVEEGLNLNHSVAQHIGYVADGREYILFLRKKTAPESSYFTIELAGKDIIQVRGNSNAPVRDEKMHNFIARWARVKKLNIKSL